MQSLSEGKRLSLNVRQPVPAFLRSGGLPSSQGSQLELRRVITFLGFQSGTLLDLSEVLNLGSARGHSLPLILSQ